MTVQVWHPSCSNRSSTQMSGRIASAIAWIEVAVLEQSNQVGGGAQIVVGLVHPQIRLGIVQHTVVHLEARKQSAVRVQQRWQALRERKVFEAHGVRMLLERIDG